MILTWYLAGVPRNMAAPWSAEVTGTQVVSVQKVTTTPVTSS